MVANALIIAIAVILAIAFTLMGQLRFFIPFKIVIWRAYSTYILAYVAVLFVNVFAAAFALNRTSSSRTLAGSCPTSTSSFMLETYICPQTQITTREPEQCPATTSIQNIIALPIHR